MLYHKTERIENVLGFFLCTEILVYIFIEIY